MQNEKVPATQADRERAAKHLRREGEPCLAEMVVNAAFDDHPLVQDFAAHRIASTTAQTEAVQKLVDALESIKAQTSAEDDAGENYRCDDREGALDFAYATANRALAAHRESQP